MSTWNVVDSLLRIAILLSAGTAILAVIRKRVGGHPVSYVTLTAGIAILLVGETAFLASAIGSTSWLSKLANADLPTFGGGYLLLMVGFILLVNDMRAAHVRARMAAADERARAEAAQDQQARLRAILDCASEYCIIGCDLRGVVTSFSAGGAGILGYAPEEVVGRLNVAQLHQPGVEPTAEQVLQAVREHGRFEGELPLVRKDGAVVPVLLTVTPLTDAGGRLAGYVAVAKDIRTLKSVEEALRRERDFARGVLETNELFIIGTSAADGHITMFNDGAERISGYRRDEVLGRHYAEVLVSPADRNRLLQDVSKGDNAAFMPAGDREYPIRTKSGEERLITWTYTISRNERGQPVHVVAFGQDVTQQRQMQASLEKARAELERANAELQRLAATDYLTGLANRRQADELLEREIARARRQGSPVGVVLMDIDHFKAINDSYGHDVGDAVLKHVARTLQDRLRATDIVARYGGEEVLLVLPDTHLNETGRVAESLRRRLQESPLVHGDLRVPLSASFGVTALEGGEAVSGDELVRRADEAMYCAKDLGRNRVVIWNRVREGKVGPSLSASAEVATLQKKIDAIAQRNREAFLESLYQLVASIEGRSVYTKDHSRNIATYAAAIARQMGLRGPEVEVIRRCAMLQDLGMAVIPDHVLWKNAPLSRDDWALVCQHPAVSVKIIERLHFLNRESFIIRHHHERPDGQGYPDGLAGDAIPLEARILAVADALNAMTRDRPHRPAMTLKEAIAQLQMSIPHQLDPTVVSAAIVAAQKAGPAWPLVPTAEKQTASAVV